MQRGEDGMHCRSTVLTGDARRDYARVDGAVTLAGQNEAHDNDDDDSGEQEETPAVDFTVGLLPPPAHAER